MVTLTTMTADECWERIGRGGVGRIGFDRGRGPRIHPVDYAVAEGALYLRTAPGTELADFVTMFGDGAFVSFEVDQVSGESAERWSVLMAAHVETLSESEVARLGRDQEPVPAPEGTRPLVVRLRPVEVTGRRLVAAAAPTHPVAPDPHRGPGVAPVAGVRRRTDYWLG